MPATDPLLGNVAITCAKCKHRIEQPVAWLRDHRSFRCPECDGPIEVSSEAVETASDAALTGLGKLLRL